MAAVTIAGAQWTVLTWNIQGGKRTDLDRVSAAIRDCAADVVVLQEVRRPQADRLASMLDMAMSWAEKHNPWAPLLRSWSEGAATLTPHRLLMSDHTRISVASSLRSYRRRIVQWSVVRRGEAAGEAGTPGRSDEIRVFNAHLSPHGLVDERRHEAERIATIDAAIGDARPTVVAGDFNDDEMGEIIDILPGVEPVPSPPTNPSRNPHRRLDHVLVPIDATDVSVSVPDGGRRWAELSDHLPLRARFTLPANTASA